MILTKKKKEKKAFKTKNFHTTSNAESGVQKYLAYVTHIKAKQKGLVCL